MTERNPTTPQDPAGSAAAAPVSAPASAAIGGERPEGSPAPERSGAGDGGGANALTGAHSGRQSGGAGGGGTGDAGKGDGDSEKVNWLSELRGFALVLLAVLAFHSLVAKPFYIPSTSMMPTLWVGDRLVVSKYPYGWSWASATFHLLPRGDWRVLGDTPEYGDIVIPVHPVRNEDYIKRVVALPGDTIAVEDGRVILNGTPIPREQVASVRIPFEPDLLCQQQSGLGSPCLYAFENYRTSGPEGDFFEPPTFRETLPNGATYLIIDHMRTRFDDFPAITVPDGHVFVMGDNRDHSADSRAPIADSGLGGPVPLENIGGRAEFITFSLDGSTGWNPVSWFTSLRPDRAWTTLRPPLVEDPAALESASDR